MSYQEQRYHHPSHSSKTEDYPYQNMSMDDSSTFVKPHHEGSSQTFTPYVFSPETAIPPPPPYPYQQFPFKSKRKRGYVIAIALLTLMVIGLGSLEIVQLTGNMLRTNSPHGFQGSNQSVTTSAHHATAHLKATPVRTLTPGTIKENITLGCGVCDDPVLTTINTITIDTTNLRLIWSVKLFNHSGTRQSVLDPKSWTQPYVNVVNRWVTNPCVVSASAVQTQWE